MTGDALQWLRELQCRICVGKEVRIHLEREFYKEKHLFANISKIHLTLYAIQSQERRNRECTLSGKLISCINTIHSVEHDRKTTAHIVLSYNGCFLLLTRAKAFST